ncbi:MAG: hypothetical protein HXM39_07030 [Lachnoanaerobaculum sp.]|jgi:hypothetical protein|nr:hypothetical protein [Lachnoanaerobaculum sp.]DAM30607.1 MAG TPA: hypothetical protein [Caudoviricetes sp.]
MWLFDDRIPKRIKQLGLSNYWDNLSKDEVDSLKTYGKKYLDCDIYKNFNFGNDQFQALWGIISIFATIKRYRSCVKTIEYMNSREIDTKDVVSKHFFYNDLINLFYKPKTPEICNFALAKMYCYDDIKLVSENKTKIKNIGDGREFPRLPSFKTLCLILEKEKNYKEAIKICDIAIKYNLKDGTKGGFVSRKERLLNKI